MRCRQHAHGLDGNVQGAPTWFRAIHHPTQEQSFASSKTKQGIHYRHRVRLGRGS